MGKNKLTGSKSIHDQLNIISRCINDLESLLFKELSDGLKVTDYCFYKIDLYEEKISRLQIKFQELFIRLYNKCISDIYYWQYCPFKVYKETFNERLKQYTNFDFVDSNEIDFYNSELGLISKSKNRYLYYFKVNINNTATLDLYFFSSENMRKIDYSQTRKIEFLKSKLKDPEVSLVANLKLNTDCSETELHEQITDTFRQKYKSLTEYIVSVDDDGKIVFLKYEDFHSKLNKLQPAQRYTNVVIWLRLLLERELITPSQIPDVLKIIKNEILIAHEEIRVFIHGVDEVGKIVLLPRKEIWEKIDQMGDGYVLIYNEFDRLITNNLLSKKYIKEHWNDREQFKRFIDKQYDFFSKQEDFKWENEIVKYARSNAPIQKKINYLTELLTDTIRVDPDNDLALKPKIKLLKSLIKELKDKQKFESPSKDKIASPIFPTKYNEPQLKSIYERSKIEFIKCSEADFLYWFAGIGESSRKIKWKKMWGKKPNKAALYWYCKQMNPKVEPGMINSVFDIEVHKKYDTAKEYSFPEINSIFNNL